MDGTTVLVILLFVTILLVISQVGVLFLIIRALSIFRADLKLEGELIEGAKSKSHSILHDAMSDANKILAESELKGLHVLSQQKLSAQDLSRHFRSHIEHVEHTLSEHFDKSTSDTEKRYNDFLKSLQDGLAKDMEKSEHAFEIRATSMLEKAQKELEEFMSTVKDKVKNQVASEFQAGKGEVDQYRKQRLKIIDERIVDMLEEVLRITLGKQLALADQSDLVYKALEEAKRENAFAA